MRRGWEAGGRYGESGELGIVVSLDRESWGCYPLHEAGCPSVGYIETDAGQAGGEVKRWFTNGRLGIDCPACVVTGLKMTGKK